MDELPDRMWDYLGLPSEQREDVVVFLSVAAPEAFDAALAAVRQVHAQAQRAGDQEGQQ